MAQGNKRRMLGAMVDEPDLPPAPKRDLARPFQTGDRALSMDDITAETNEIPGVPHGKSAGMGRGITRREDRERFRSPKQAREDADRDAAAGGREYRRRLSDEVQPRKKRKPAPRARTLGSLVDREDE